METIFDSFLKFDLAVFEWIQSIQSPVLTTIMKIITTLGDDGIFFILIGLVLLVTKKFRKIGIAMLLSLLVMEVGNNLILKELFARPRPFFIFNPEAIPLDHKYYDELLPKVQESVARMPELAKQWVETYVYPDFVHAPSSWSFPSGHTSSAFAAMVAVFILNKKVGIPAVIFAFLMGLSRVYVEVHYATDVIAGAIVGVVYAVIGILLTKLVFDFVDKTLDKVFAKFKKDKKAA